MAVNAGEKTKIVCVDTTYNADIYKSDNVLRLKSFDEKGYVFETENKDALGEKSVKEKTKIYLFYRFLKFVGSPIVVMKYKPIVIGTNCVFKGKSVAFIGNHRTKQDPIILISIVKQVIHWAALQRMFTGGEDLFSNSKH